MKKNNNFVAWVIAGALLAMAVIFGCQARAQGITNFPPLATNSTGQAIPIPNWQNLGGFADWYRFNWAVTNQAAAYSTVTASNGLFLGGSTNGSLVSVFTNWVDGFVYSNGTGRSVYVFSQCRITPGASASVYGLQVGGVTVSQLATSAEALGTFPGITNSVQYLVTNSATFAFTNLTGTGAIMTGGYYEVH